MQREPLTSTVTLVAGRGRAALPGHVPAVRAHPAKHPVWPGQGYIEPRCCLGQARVNHEPPSPARARLCPLSRMQAPQRAMANQWYPRMNPPHRVLPSLRVSRSGWRSGHLPLFRVQRASVCTMRNRIVFGASSRVRATMTDIRGKNGLVVTGIGAQCTDIAIKEERVVRVAPGLPEDAGRVIHSGSEKRSRMFESYPQRMNEA